MIFLENLTELLVSTDLLEEIATYVSQRDIELILSDDDFIRMINKEHRGKDAPTDVLSFPISGDRESEPVGSIVISMNQVIAQAEAFGHLPQDELALLFIHGLLHLLGHDHESDKGQMRKHEEELIRHFDLPTSLIVRSERF